MDSVSLSLGYGYGEFMNQNKPSMNRYRNQVVYGLNLSLFRYLNVSFQCDYDSTGGKDNLFKTGLSIPLAGRQAPYDHFRF